MVWYTSKLTTIALGIFVFFVLTYLLFDLVFNISSVVELQIKQLPPTWMTSVIIVALLISDILIPIPSSIVIVVSGMLFGPLLGGLIALTGSLVGSVINFQISRRLGQTKVKRWLKSKDYNRLTTIIQKYGAYIIILTRMMPLAMESTSSIAGISHMPLKKFIFLNILGFLPITFLYSYTGAVYKNEPQNILMILVIGFFVPLIIWQLILYYSNLRKSTRSLNHVPT